MKVPNEKIDFVIPWVDGNDSDWQRDKAQYSEDVVTGNEIERYRE